MNLAKSKGLTGLLAMCRGHLRNAIAPRGDELYLGNHFLVDAIRVLPVVVPERERPSCCQLCSGGTARGLQGVYTALPASSWWSTCERMQRCARDARMPADGRTLSQKY